MRLFYNLHAIKLKIAYNNQYIENQCNHDLQKMPFANRIIGSSFFLRHVLKWPTETIFNACHIKHNILSWSSSKSCLSFIIFRILYVGCYIQVKIANMILKHWYLLLTSLYSTSIEMRIFCFLSNACAKRVKIPKIFECIIL